MARTISMGSVVAVAWLAGLGCAVPAGDAAPQDQVGADESSIVSGNDIFDGAALARATVALPICTGVIIGAKHVVTAASCLPLVGQVIRFYDGPTPNGSTRTIANVTFRPGVNPFFGDLTDNNDDHADLALLTLSATIPLTSKPARLPLSFLGQDKSGQIVGSGSHDGLANPSRVLKWEFAKILSSDANGGTFLTSTTGVDNGDRGGGFFAGTASSLTVHGILAKGPLLLPPTLPYYTGIEHYLDWLLAEMSFTGGLTVESGKARPGGNFQVFTAASFRRCALACAQSSTCAAYTYTIFPSMQCELKSVANPQIVAPMSISGIK
jgi:hypothetical protein